MVLRSGTERDGANGSGGNNNRNNEVPLPNPPVHPSLADVLARQTKLMATIVNKWAMLAIMAQELSLK